MSRFKSPRDNSEDSFDGKDQLLAEIRALDDEILETQELLTNCDAECEAQTKIIEGKKADNRNAEKFKKYYSFWQTISTQDDQVIFPNSYPQEP